MGTYGANDNKTYSFSINSQPCINYRPQVWCPGGSPRYNIRPVTSRIFQSDWAQGDTQALLRMDACGRGYSKRQHRNKVVAELGGKSTGHAKAVQHIFRDTSRIFRRNACPSVVRLEGRPNNRLA